MLAGLHRPNEGHHGPAVLWRQPVGVAVHDPVALCDHVVEVPVVRLPQPVRVKGWRWWVKAILPGIFPYYITGAITASGGSWNASIVAEVASWGDSHLQAAGLGAYIANATEAGDFPRVVLGITVMCILVTLFNRLLWRPLYAFGERRLRLG